MKKNIVSIILIFLCVSLALTSCTKNGASVMDGVRVTDMVGREVVVPKNPQSICVLDPFAAPVVVMLGYGTKMPTTINVVSRCLLLQSICPALKNDIVVKSSGAMNAESILKAKTDLMIVGPDTYSNDNEKAKLKTLGIPYIVVTYSSMADQMNVVTLLGKALQNEALADKYVSFYRKCIDDVKEGIAKIPEGQAVKLYHSVEEAARTDSKGTLSADWISLMRVNNVSLDTQLNMTEGKAYATLEQIYNWDPDIIIANESGVADYILSDSKWHGLRAVTDKTVYQIPIGISRWGHPTSIETPLAILWLAALLYPQQFSTDIRTEMTSFYKTFFNYSISKEEADNIISGYGIRTPKPASAK